MNEHSLRGTFDRLGKRLMAAIARGNKTTGRDDGNVQLLQVQLGDKEIHDNLPRLAEFGFASMPPDGSHAVVLFVGGDRSNGVVVATGHIATRLKNLQPGESALYHADGKHVYLKADRIEIDAKGQPVNVINASEVNVTASGGVTVNAAGVTINCDVTVNGSVHATGDVTAGSISLDGHVHGGVMTGGSNTTGPQ
jgi:phage baseplate assembly protein V